jgi:hypothetical protein
LQGLLLAAGCDAAAAIPVGVQPDWEAMLRPLPGDFVVFMRGWMFPGGKGLPGDTGGKGGGGGGGGGGSGSGSGGKGSSGGAPRVSSGAGGGGGWLSSVGAAADVALLPDVAAILPTYQDMVRWCTWHTAALILPSTDRA